MGKILRPLGFSRISARPAHPQAAPGRQARVQKKLPELIAAAGGEPGRGKRLEIRFPDG